MAILDPYGRPVSSGGRFLDAAHNGGDRPMWPPRSESILKAVNTYDWRTVVYASRRLFANMGVPRGAIFQKSMFAVGRAWRPVFRGKDADWGKLAREWLVDEFFPACEVRGGAFDFVTSLFVDSVAIDRDGGYGILFTKDDDGFPQTQRIPIHRFGSRWDSRESIVQDGKFKGLSIHQGIIYNRHGKPVAYRVYEDPINTEVSEANFRDISAQDLLHVYDPEWHDQGHGFPAFTHALNDLRDMQQSQKWEQLAMLIASSIGLIEHNESGGADPNDPAFLGADCTVSETGIQSMTFEGGLVRYFKANSGAKLEQFVNQRPGEDWDKFNDRLTRAALCGIQWPTSMAWKPDGGGTDTRADIMKARASVEDRQDLLRPVARRIVGYALSVAMTPRKDGGLGALPAYRGSDAGGFLKWSFSVPPKIGIDDGRDAQQRLDNLDHGVTTLEADQADRGGDWLETRAQRQREVIDLVQRAQGVVDATGVPFETALVLMQQSTPNATPPGAQPGAATQEQDK